MRHLRRALSCRPAAVWGTILLTPAVLDIWCDRNDIPGDSLSECIRDTFHTDTTYGRVAFLGGWAVLSGWFIPHILRGPRERK